MFAFVGWVAMETYAAQMTPSRENVKVDKLPETSSAADDVRE